MNKIITLMMMLVLSVALFAGIPHPVFVEYTGTVTGFTAYLGTDETTVLTDQSVGCGILTDYNLIMVECGNFPVWEFADVLYVLIDGEYTQVILGYDNVQALTGEEAIWYPGIPGGEITQEGVFAAGWNLWSYNVMLSSHAVEDVFAGLTYLTKVKSIEQSYDPTLGSGFNTLNVLEDGYGYWVQVSEADQMELTGDPINLDTEIALNTGWNLVAYLPQTGQAPEDAFDALITPGYLTKVKSIGESYDPALDENFNTLDALNPGNGYWVNVNTAVAFTYPAPVRSFDTAEAVEYIWTPVIYTNSTCAYATIEAEGQIAAFVNGECRGVSQIKNGCVSLVINGTEAETATFKLYQNGQVIDLNSEITTAPGEDVFFDFTSEAPVSTKLMNAYPNPFNPQTTIAYTTSEAGNVNVAVYNVKGQKVAELVNSSQEAGTHSVVWNAAGQASGIYFVKMNAGNTEQIQKLILMK